MSVKDTKDDSFPDWFHAAVPLIFRFSDFPQFKVTPTTFYEISKISHICSVFRKSFCIRVVHIF